MPGSGPLTLRAEFRQRERQIARLHAPDLLHPVVRVHGYPVSSRRLATDHTLVQRHQIEQLHGNALGWLFGQTSHKNHGKHVIPLTPENFRITLACEVNKPQRGLSGPFVGGTSIASRPKPENRGGLL